MNDKYSEQGISVFEVSDYEWMAAATKDAAIQCALDLWGYPNIESAESAGSFSLDDVSGPCDLDANKMNRAEDDQDEQLVTWREYLKEMIARGDEFPAFFCGIDA